MPSFSLDMTTFFPAYHFPDIFEDLTISPFSLVTRPSGSSMLISMIEQAGMGCVERIKRPSSEKSLDMPLTGSPPQLNSTGQRFMWRFWIRLCFLMRFVCCEPLFAAPGCDENIQLIDKSIRL